MKDNTANTKKVAVVDKRSSGIGLETALTLTSSCCIYGELLVLEIS